MTTTPRTALRLVLSTAALASLLAFQPANATMQPMRFQERDVLIQGVVVGVIRKY